METMPTNWSTKNLPLTQKEINAAVSKAESLINLAIIGKIKSLNKEQMDSAKPSLVHVEHTKALGYFSKLRGALAE